MPEKERDEVFWSGCLGGFFVSFNVLSYLDVIPGFLKALVFLVLFLLVLELVYQDSHNKKILLTLFMYILGMGVEFIVYQGSGLFGIDRRTLVVSGSRRRMAEREKYYIALDGQYFEVSRELYEAYYKGRRKEKYFIHDLKQEHTRVDREGKDARGGNKAPGEEAPERRVWKPERVQPGQTPYRLGGWERSGLHSWSSSAMHSKGSCAWRWRKRGGSSLSRSAFQIWTERKQQKHDMQENGRGKEQVERNQIEKEAHP